jgi:hypothetical protein
MLDKIKKLIRNTVRIGRQTETAIMLHAESLIKINNMQSSNNINDYEFRAFSQWGEDGIIQYLIHNLNIEHKSFIEFGVEDFFESNCRFLMMHDHWSGFVIDGSQKNIDKIQSSNYFFKYQLEAKCSFITKENICDLLEQSGLPKNLGILSVDIDGIDYFVFEQLSAWKPAIYIFEYNSLFGNALPVSVPYDPAFQRTQKHYSNVYWGASLPAFDQLAVSRGYSLVGVNMAGSNAFYVRNDLLNDRVVATSVEDCFRPMSFRESRDEQGRLTFLTGQNKLDLVKDLPLVNVVSGEIITVADAA